MPIKINYSKKLAKKIDHNTVLFVDEKFSISSIKKYISDIEFSYIKDLLKANDLKKKF